MSNREKGREDGRSKERKEREIRKRERGGGGSEREE